jgi:cytochrome c-type biogenesis protein CcmH
MTGFAFAVALCVAVAIAFAAWPLLRRRAVIDHGDRRGTNVELYRQRVAEIERDRDAGGLSAEVAAALVQEQAAALLDDAAQAEPGTSRGGRSVAAAVVVAAAIAATSLALYQQLGAYDAVALADATKVLRVAEPDPAALGDLVVRLRARVAKVPDDLESDFLLGHALMRLDDPRGATEAFERVYAVQGDDPSVQLALAQARFAAAGGKVTGDNRALIDQILAADPRQTIALEMLALDAFGSGDYVSAARHLQNALAGGGAGARAATLREGLQRARELMGDIGPWLDVTIEIPDAIRNAMPASAQLFVFARKPGERMPLLVSRSTLDAGPMSVRLDRTNAMQGDVALNAGETLTVAARLSANGDLASGSGDAQAGVQAVTLQGGATPVRLVLAAAPATTPAAASAAAAAEAAADVLGNVPANVAVNVAVALAPGVAAAAPARVFVIARAPGGPPMPIAVRVLDPAALPQQLVLTDADAMQPNRRLSMFERVEVVARLSRSGNPVRQPGDVESPAQTLDPHAGGAVSLVIGG